MKRCVVGIDGNGVGRRLLFAHADIEFHTCAGLSGGDYLCEFFLEEFAMVGRYCKVEIYDSL